MIETLIQRITRERPTCYWISPHLDDAIFSAGSLIARLAPITDCRIITVFTAGDTPITLSARQFLRQSGVRDPHELFRRRCQEDTVAGEMLGASVTHLGFVDALFRHRPMARPSRWLPERYHVYPTYRWHVARGQVSVHDRELQQQLATALRRHIPADQPSVVFAPLATGRHVDHVLVRDVCVDVFPDLYFWNDLPYGVTATPDQIFIQQHRLQFESYPMTAPARAAMEAYTSQFSIVYPQADVANTPEQFAARKEAA